jgi:hypothetical protein
MSIVGTRTFRVVFSGRVFPSQGRFEEHTITFSVAGTPEQMHNVGALAVSAANAAGYEVNGVVNITTVN